MQSRILYLALSGASEEASDIDDAEPKPCVFVAENFAKVLVK